MSSVINDFSAEAEKKLTAVFGAPGKWSCRVIGLDTEGVDLSRLGRLCIVQLATEEETIVLDVLNMGPSEPLVAWLRVLLEDVGVEKVIHDCKMDSDALWHHLQIKLENVHDTSAWHEAILGERSRGLNDTLEFYRLCPNPVRDKGVYDRNLAFWATRPMTPMMVEWAVGDLHSMFALRLKQLERASASAARRGAKESEIRLASRDAQVRTFKVRGSVGRFIGPRGQNIRALQDRTDTIIYGHGEKNGNEFVVYYKSDMALKKVLRAAGEV